MDTNEPNLLTIRVNLNNDKKQNKNIVFNMKANTRGNKNLKSRNS